MNVRLTAAIISHGAPSRLERFPGDAWRAVRFHNAVLFFFLLSFFVLIIQTICMAIPEFGPGMNANVNNLLSNNDKEYPLPAGWEVSGYHYTDFDIDAHLKGPGGKQLDVRIAHTLLPSSMRLIGKTAHFRVEVADADYLSGAAAADALFKRIRHNDSLTFLSSPGMRSREGIEEHVFYRYLFAPFLLFILALSLILFLINLLFIRENLLPGGWGARIALFAILLTGFFLRFYLAPRTPIHTNNHGIREVRTIVYPQSPEQKEMLYGVVYPTTMRWLTGIVGDSEENVFRINILLGTLAILSIYILGKSLFKTEEAALFSALCLSVSPLQVWLSGTEAPAAMYQFAGLAGLALMAASVQNEKRSAFFLSILFLLFAASLQLLTVLIIPAALVLFIYYYYENESAGKKSLIDGAWIFIIIACAWLAFHFKSLASEKIGEGVGKLSGTGGLFHNLFSLDNTLLDPTRTAFILPLLAAAGYCLAWRRKRLGLAFTLVILAVVPISSLVFASRTDAIRYQGMTLWIFYLLAAFVFSTDIKFNGWIKRRAVIASAAGLLVIAGSTLGLYQLHERDEEINEYLFIRQSINKIPSGAVIRLPTRGAASGKLMVEFPDYIGGHPLVRGADKGVSGSNEIVYIGLDCYRYRGDSEKAESIIPSTGMRRECSQVCGGHPVKIVKTTLDAKVYGIGFQKRHFELGTRYPVIGFYRCDSEK